MTADSEMGSAKLLRVPGNEAETMLLASLLFRKLRLCLWRANNQYPDWILLFESSSGWRRMNVEVEFESSKFKSHLADHRRVPTGSRLILCWIDDSNPTHAAEYPHPIPALALRDVLADLPAEERTEICHEARDLPACPGGLSRSLEMLERVAADCPLEAGVPAGFGGLVHEPTNEYETELASMLMLGWHDPRCQIHARPSRGADWKVKVANGSSWSIRSAEIEHLASGYNHKETFDELICWRFDRSRFNGPHRWELQQSFKKLPKQDQEQLCLLRQAPSFRAGTTPREIPRELRFMPAEAQRVFLELVSRLGELGIGPNTGTSGKREGMSFHFAPGYGTETLNLFPGYSGRYVFPTIWFSLSSIRKALAERGKDVAALEAEAAKLNPITLSTSNKGRHVVFGVTCVEHDFSQAIEPILRIAQMAVDAGLQR